MADAELADQDPQDDQDVLRDEGGALRPDFVDTVRAAIESGDGAALRELVSDLHEADLGDLVTALDADLRARLIELLGEDFDYAAFTELDDAIRAQLIDDLPAEDIAAGVRELESDDAVFILEDLEEADQQEILKNIPALERVALERSLDYPEDSAGRLMQADFIAVPPFWTVGQTIDYMREADDLPDEFYEVFIIDPGFRILGTVALNKILRTKRPTPVSKIMDETRRSVHVTDDQEEVAHIFERYDLVSAPVLDDSERLVGVITVDDIVDVIHEEAEEDILALAGVGDEEVSDTVIDTAKGRFPWLIVNLGTAVLASFVIGLFDASIEKMVALAILMPIVASMGGNAATQTMTVAVRALATRDLDIYNMARVIVRETAVGFLNGAVFAVIMGAVAALWFGNTELGGVIGTAMIVNMVAAGLSGILIPIALDRMKIDPAIASSVFVTTVTDVVGFFAFLGLAAWWFQL